MTQKEKYEAIGNAYTTKKRGEEDIQIYSENLAEEVKQKLMDISYKLGVGFEISYDIMSDACMCISDIELEKLEQADFNETETASVYTATRLSYLSNTNESEITEITKEYECDIQTACAVWYDRQVATACEKIKDYILEN